MRIPRADGAFRWLILSGSLLLAGQLNTAQDTGQTVPAADQAAYEEFHRLLAIGEYASALQHAQEIVRIEKSHDAESGVLSVAYHQLGKVQLLTGDANAAVASLQRALQLLESSESIFSHKYIGPLGDLAESQAALGNHDAAIAAMHQAIAIGRRTKGLFNADQVVLLDRMAKSFESIGDIDGVDHARRYAVLVAEQQFGQDHPDSLPSISKLANWFELTGRYAMARALYERMARIASLEGGERNATVINSLLGVGRSHRLQYVETPEMVESSFWGARPAKQFDPVTGQKEAIAGAVDRPGFEGTATLSRQGIEALMKCLELLESVSDPPSDLLARTLVEIGDWYQTGTDPKRAISYYKRAWPLLEEVSTTAAPNPLLAPRPMFYRLPPNWRQNRVMQHGHVVERQVEFVMTITDRGDVTDLIRKSGDMTEGQGWQVARTLSHATFSPRFENGEPVATVDFSFTESRFETKPEAEAAAAPADPITR